MKLFEGQSKEDVLRKAVVVAAIIPMLDDLRNLPGPEAAAEDRLQAIDDMAARFIDSLDLLGLHLHAHVTELDIIENIAAVVDMMGVPKSKEKIH